MIKDPEVFLKHIIESIDEIENHIKNCSKSTFSQDIKTQDAVFRRLEIIGEAIKNIPSDFKNRNRQIDWRNIAAMRNKLIHEYFGVDLNLVWEVVKKDIPKLKKDVLGLL